jgi:diaminopimelate epimerase
MRIKIYSAAGGNATAIVFGEKINRDKYYLINNDIQNKNPEVEQVGFLEEKNGLPFLQMAGGEFCGNATRAFACFLKEQTFEKNNYEFYVSGFDNKVVASVFEISEKEFFCKVFLPGLVKLAKVKKIKLFAKNVVVVDLGGIIHILVNEEQFPFSQNNYVKNMKTIKNKLKIDCDAVGVIWIRKEEKEKIFIKPVVWVKAIDTCYYETSCGSASIAVGMALSQDVRVIQPSLKEIEVGFNKKNIILSSEMRLL